MTTYFERILTDVFDRGAEARLSIEEEREAIRLAKTGDEAATVALCYAYSPTLRNAEARHRETLGAEARHVAVIGLLEAVHAFDLDGTHRRLAAIVWQYVTDELLEAAGSTNAVLVPARTLKRFFGILRKADGDFASAVDLAEAHNMARETFYAVRAALGVDSLDVSRADGETITGTAGFAREDGWAGADTRPLWETPASEEDRVLVEAAFLAVDDLERDVVRVKYGFEGEASDRTLSDDATVHALSVRDLGEDAVLEGQSVISRQKVQRTHASALAKMREALCA